MFRYFGAALLSLLSVAGLALTSVSALQFPPTFYSGMQWRMIGPFRGGRTIAVAGIAGESNTFYFGAAGGGVWKTTNVGMTWVPVSDSLPVASIGAIAIARSDPKILYVGTGEADIRSDISFGAGMYKSSDGGASWAFIGLADTRHISRIWVDPHDPNRLMAAALGHAYGPNPERGVFRSTDGGKSWTKVLYKDEFTGAIDLAVDPTDSRIAFAALWNAHRPPWSVYAPIQGSGSCLYSSRDGGINWQQVTAKGLPAGDWGRVAIAIAESGGIRRIYALIDAQENAGLYRSDDGGTIWSRLCIDPRITERQWYFGTLTVDPHNADVLYVPNVSLMRSTDGGRTFESFKGAPGGDDYHMLWIDPQNSRRMIAGSDQGAVVTVDGGATWSTWLNQPTAQFYHVATDNRFPYYVYGAQQDSGTVASASRSDFGSITYRDWYSVGGGESGYIVPAPDNPNIVYTGDTYGKLFRFDRITNQAQDISPNPVTVWGTEMEDREMRFTWTSPLAFAPFDSSALYFGAQYVMKTRDGGASWQIISPDLTGAEPESPIAGALNVSNAKSRGYGVVYTIAPSPLDPKIIWAGSDTGMIHLTRDSGKTWTSVTPKGIADWSKISILEASHFDRDSAYAAVDRHRLDDFTPHILRTHDGGRSWQEISSGIVAPDYVHAVREDPRRQGLLYAATETGVYVSFDDGGRWQSLKLNMPVTPVHDLVVHEDDLVIATHGRSFWILDDIEPLRELSAEIAAASSHLFLPQTAFRVQRNVNNDTPLAPETPAGKNPPAGAVIDYYLAHAANKVTLKIFDSQGRLVRQFSSDDKPDPVPGDLKFPSDWIRRPAVLSKDAGMHRMVWDLYYPKPPVLNPEYTIAAAYGEDTPEVTLGPLALPGKYQVMLQVDEQTHAAPMTLKMDPRVSTSFSELSAQFELEMSLSQALDKNFAALKQVRLLRSQLKDLEKRSAGNSGLASLMAPIKSLAAKAGTMEAGSVRSRSSNMASLNDRLATLLAAVEHADAAPTAQEMASARDLAAELSEQLAAWDRLKDTEVAALNGDLDKIHVDRIKFGT